VANYVRALQADLPHEGTAVGRLLRDAQRTVGVGTASEPTPMVQGELIPFRQNWL
jgi:hypothetical protein